MSHPGRTGWTSIWRTSDSTRRRPLLVAAALLLMAACDGLPPYLAASCRTDVFAAFEAPPGEMIDCARVWENLDAIEEIWSFRFRLTYPYEFRPLFQGVSVHLWASEEALRARCDDLVPDWGRLYGCLTGSVIHLDAGGHALLHEMEHVLHGAGHDWPLSCDIASAEFWATNQRPM